MREMTAEADIVENEVADLEMSAEDERELDGDKDAVTDKVALCDVVHVLSTVLVTDTEPKEETLGDELAERNIVNEAEALGQALNLLEAEVHAVPRSTVPVTDTETDELDVDDDVPEEERENAADAEEEVVAKADFDKFGLDVIDDVPDTVLDKNADAVTLTLAAPVTEAPVVLDTNPVIDDEGDTEGELESEWVIDGDGDTERLESDDADVESVCNDVADAIVDGLTNDEREGDTDTSADELTVGEFECDRETIEVPDTVLVDESDDDTDADAEMVRVLTDVELIEADAIGETVFSPLADTVSDLRELGVIEEEDETEKDPHDVGEALSDETALGDGVGVIETIDVAVGENVMLSVADTELVVETVLETLEELLTLNDCTVVFDADGENNPVGETRDVPVGGLGVELGDEEIEGDREISGEELADSVIVLVRDIKGDAVGEKEREAVGDTDALRKGDRERDDDGVCVTEIFDETEAVYEAV